jgi:hypothetical protein
MVTKFPASSLPHELMIDVLSLVEALLLPPSLSWSVTGVRMFWPGAVRQTRAWERSLNGICVTLWRYFRLTSYRGGKKISLPSRVNSLKN